MPFSSKSDQLSGRVPSIFPSGPEVVAQRCSIIANASDVALNAVGALAILPAGCLPVGIFFEAAAAISADIGVLNDAETGVSSSAIDGGAPWLLATAANGNAFAFNKGMAQMQPASYDRKIGLRVTTAGSPGLLALTLLYRYA